MKQKFLQNLRENRVNQIPIIFSFFSILLIIRIVEFFTYLNNTTEENIKIGYLFGGIIQDFILSNFVVFLLTFLFSGFNLIRLKTYVPHNIILICILHFQIALSLVFVQSFEPLGEIFYHFTIEELKKITGIENFKLLYIVPTIFISIIYLIFYSVFSKILANKKQVLGWKTFVFFGLFFGLFPILNYKSKKHLNEKMVVNKFAFFSIQSFKYATKFESNSNIKFNVNQLEENFIDGITSKTEYPILHSFKKDSTFATFFKKSEKEPNIVIIIIEGLSTQLVGKYAKKTGHILPFLDSLTKKSIYFPNSFSTAERTFNVLPAVLSSVPNCPDNNKFMDLVQLPKHWSAMNLLKKKYFSSFYCGVYLEFDNMKNFIEYQETDYIVKNWENQFNKDFSKSNIWGYPDQDLFGKNILERNRKQEKSKSRLDVLLTVSSHDPYCVPNQRHFEKEIIKEISSIQKKNDFHQFILENPQIFATYRYTDHSVREYFKQLKKMKEFDNTIFIITGDHGNQTFALNDIHRISVPIIVYSKLLKKSYISNNFKSHHDILPSLLSLLHLNYKLKVPENVPFMGKGLFINKNNMFQPVMNLNYENSFLISGNNYLFHDQLYKINSNLDLKQVENENKLNTLKHKLIDYNNLSRYLIFEDKILPESYYEKFNNSIDFNFYSKSFIEKIKSNKEFIKILDTINFQNKLNGIQIELSFDIKLNTKNELEKLPSLACTVKENEKVLLWKNAHAMLNSVLKKGKFNTVKYFLKVGYNEIKGNNKPIVDYYLLNIIKKEFEMKNINIRISTR